MHYLYGGGETIYISYLVIACQEAGVVGILSWFTTALEDNKLSKD